MAGFGLGATVISPIATELIKPANLGLARTFNYLGIAYLIIVVVAAQFYRKARITMPLQAGSLLQPRKLPGSKEFLTQRSLIHAALVYPLADSGP